MSNLPHVYRAEIPGKVGTGTTITLEGKVNSGTSRFDIELKHNQDCNDVPFHASFRFNDHCVVRNHHTPGGWGSEEREGGMPLSSGNNFIIQFKINSDNIAMSVNGGHFCNFKHRLPTSSISCVAVYGGASVSSVKFG